MYSDTITHKELADALPRFGLSYENPAQRVLNDRRRQLLNLSGAKNVTSGVLTIFEDINRMTVELLVSFNSAAWTGR